MEQSEAEIADERGNLARLLACALGDSLSVYETQAQQVQPSYLELDF